MYKEAVNMIIRGVPIKLHREYKAKCARLGVTQQAQFIELMRRFVEEDNAGEDAK